MPVQSSDDKLVRDPAQRVQRGGFEACPFCGDGNPFVERSDLTSCYVQCNQCGAQGPIQCQESEDEETPGHDAAIRVWNARAHQPPAGAGGREDGNRTQGVRWAIVNDEPFEYAIQQCPHGDEFVKLINGECLRRPITPSLSPVRSAEALEAAADAIDLARYQHPDHPRERPRPFSEADRHDREYAFRLARAALKEGDK